MCQMSLGSITGQGALNDSAETAGEAALARNTEIESKTAAVAVMSNMECGRVRGMRFLTLCRLMKFPTELAQRFCDAWKILAEGMEVFRRF